MSEAVPLVISSREQEASGGQERFEEVRIHRNETEVLSIIGGEGMAEDSSVPGYINPLAFFEVDEPWASITKATPTANHVLEYLCPPDAVSTVAEIVARYKQISIENENRLFVVPLDPVILEKLVWPLRHAKGAYAVGNYVGTVALCGMVAEMVAMLILVLQAKPG